MNKEKLEACIVLAEQLAKMADEIRREVGSIQCYGYVYSDKHRARAYRRSLDLSDDLVRLRRMLYDKE